MTRSILFLTLLSLTSGAAAGQLLPAGSQDLVPQRLSATQPKAVRALPSEELHYAWALEADASLSTTAPHTAESREFWADHDSADWQSGIRIHTTQPGALVRISPIGTQRSALQPSELIVERDGRRYGNASALSSVASASDLADGAAPFPEGTTAFRLNASLGAGAFTLQAPMADGRYLIHVFEPDSNAVLKLQSGRDAQLAGDALTIRAQFEESGRTTQLDRLVGVLTAPDGRSVDLAFDRQRDGSYLASVPAPTAADVGGPVPWEVHAFGAKGEVLRDAKTAVGITNPVARLSGSVEHLPVRAHGNNVVLRFGVEAASAGRYQLTGTLWGTNATGQLVPVATAQSAKMLNGNDGIELQFLDAVIGPAAVRAPYELRDLRLQNQADMGLLERRELAWRSDTSSDSDK